MTAEEFEQTAFQVGVTRIRHSGGAEGVFAGCLLASSYFSSRQQIVVEVDDGHRVVWPIEDCEVAP